VTRRHPRFLDARLSRFGGWLQVWGVGLIVAHVGSPAEGARAEWARHYRPNRFAFFLGCWAVGLGVQGFLPKPPRGWSRETPWLLRPEFACRKLELTARRLTLICAAPNEMMRFAGLDAPASESGQ
jgi:hypothetical protein